MKKHILLGKKREDSGRKVKHLRAGGVLPATVYGKKVTSFSVTVQTSEFKKIYHEAGETGLVELTIDKDIHPVLIHNVQIDPVDESLLHVEFYQVDLKVKVKTKVPLQIVGESPAVTERKGVILSLLTEIEVEALPTDLPEHIEVDVTSLAEVGQEITVSQLAVPSEVTILTDLEVSVVKIDALVSKEAEAQAAADAAAAAAATAEVAEAPATEGAATEVKTDEKPADKTTEKSAE